MRVNIGTGPPINKVPSENRQKKDDYVTKPEYEKTEKPVITGFFIICSY
jgi:hypothetical protein